MPNRGITSFSLLIVFYAFFACHCESFVDRPIERRPVAKFTSMLAPKYPNTYEHSNGKIKREFVLAAAADSVNAAAFKAILKLASTCGLGALATKIGFIDKNSLSVLSKLVFNVFQPALLFVNVAATISEALKLGDNTIFLFPFAAIVQIFLGYLIGKITSFVMYGKVDYSDDKNQLLACTTFGNSGPLPFVFTDSLFRTHADTSLYPRSVAYISMYLLAWSPLFWSLGSSILAEDESKLSKKEKRNQLITRILSPPIIASIAGLVVGSVPFLRSPILSPRGIFNPIFEALKTLSQAYLPAVLLILAGSLLPTPDKVELPLQSDGDLNTPPKPKYELQEFVKRVGAVYISRFLILPTVSFASIYLMQKYVPAAARIFSANKLLLFILLLETCMPSAQNSTVVLQLQGNVKAAASMARTLVAIYILGLPAMSFWLAKILGQTKLLG